MDTPPMPSGSLWSASWDTLYVAYYHELSAQYVVERWQKIDFSVAILIALTASGSAIAGWGLWNRPGWKILWVAVVGAAALLSTLHGVAGVPGRIKEQEQIRRKFSGVRTRLETFRQGLALGANNDSARKEYDELRKRFDESVENSSNDLALTRGLQVRVQDRVNELLKEGIKDADQPR